MLPHCLFITVTILAGVQWSCKVAFHLHLIDPEPPDRPLKHTSIQLASAKVELNVSLNRSFLLPLYFGMISLRRFFRRHMTLLNLNLILINIFAPVHKGPRQHCILGRYCPNVANILQISAQYSSKVQCYLGSSQIYPEVVKKLTTVDGRVVKLIQSGRERIIY